MCFYLFYIIFQQKHRFVSLSNRRSSFHNPIIRTKIIIIISKLIIRIIITRTITIIITNNTKFTELLQGNVDAIIVTNNKHKSRCIWVWGMSKHTVKVLHSPFLDDYSRCCKNICQLYWLIRAKHFLLFKYILDDNFSGTHDIFGL